MLILTGCHVTCESSLLTYVESSGITPWYIGRSLARLFLMTSMFFYSSFLIRYQWYNSLVYRKVFGEIILDDFHVFFYSSFLIRYQ